MKNVNITALEDWLINLAVVIVILNTDVFLVKTSLSDAEVICDDVSLLRDNRVLISFDSHEKFSLFLGMKEAFKEFFYDIVAWKRNAMASKRMVLINVVDIPIRF